MPKYLVTRNYDVNVSAEVKSDSPDAALANFCRMFNGCDDPNIRAQVSWDESLEIDWEPMCQEVLDADSKSGDDPLIFEALE